MAKHHSSEVSANDPEKLLRKIRLDIPVVVGQVCRKLDHNPDQAELDDFVQRITMLLIKDDYRVLRSFDGLSKPQTWLFTIAWRHILHWLREQGRMVSLDDMPPDSFIVQPDQEKWLLAKERDEILQAAVGKLTKRERDLWELWRDGQSNDEIAEKMKIKKKTISTKKGALMKKLQRLVRACRINELQNLRAFQPWKG